MKKLLLLTATLIIAACFVSCRDRSKMENSDRTLYAQDLSDALCLESKPLEPPVEEPFENLDFNIPEEDLWIYRGKVGDVDATFHFTIEFDKVSDGQICGYVVFDREELPKTALRILQNEPNPNGFNKVVFEDLTPDGVVLGTYTGIVEGRGDGFNGEYKVTGEEKPVAFESMREY